MPPIKTPLVTAQADSGAVGPTINTQPPAYDIPQSFDANGNPSHGRGIVVGLLIFLLIVLVGGGVGYAYMMQVWPFAPKAPYDTERLASSIFEGIDKIESASYEVKLLIEGAPRDADAVPFKVAVPKDKAEELAYKRDQDRVRAIQTLRGALSQYKVKNKGEYPDSLGALVPPVSVPPEIRYTLSEGKSDYVLSVTLESRGAPAALKRLTSQLSEEEYVNGSTLTVRGQGFYYLSLPAETPQPMLVHALQSQELLGRLPADFKLDTALRFTTMKRAGGVDGTISFMLGLEVTDVTLAIDMEARKVLDTLYVVVNKFPILFLDIAPLKGTWVKFTKDDLISGGAKFVNKKDEEAQRALEENKEKLVRMLKQFLIVADTNKLLTVLSEPKQEDVDGLQLFKYELGLNRDTYAVSYEEFIKLCEAEFPGECAHFSDETTLAYLKGPEFKAVLDYFAKNTSYTLWVDREGIPHRITYNARIVPDGKGAAAKRQVNVAVSVLLRNVNTPVSIDAPTESISVEDATILLSGMSREEYRIQKQLEAVRTVRSALNRYKLVTGTFPETLDLLTKATEDLPRGPTQKGESNPFDLLEKGSGPLIKSVPNDIYTNTPFAYGRKGDDFQLIYTIELPKFDAGEMSVRPYLSFGTYEYDRSGSGGSLAGSKVKALSLRVVQGNNTATKDIDSIEALATQSVDTDKDNLSDALEEFIGTDKNKKDTDGDGVNDRDEVERNSNPLGPGALEVQKKSGTQLPF